MSLQAIAPFDIGELDSRVVLLSPSQTRDAGGGTPTTWVSQGTVWARFRPQTGREIQQAGQKIALALAMFRVRYKAAIDATWRVMFGSTIYELIAPPVAIDRNRFVDLVCQALAPSNFDINGVGVQRMTVPLSQGDTSKAVTYDMAFVSVPTAVYAIIVAPNGGYVIDCVVRAGATETGCIIDFGADIPASGYSLSIIAVL